MYLFFAFLLPLFPDDVLCVVAGALPIKWLTFTIMQLITRFTSITATMVFMSGAIIPYKDWGLVVLGLIVLISVVLFIIGVKYADKINAKFEVFVNKILNKKSKHKTKE